MVLSTDGNVALVQKAGAYLGCLKITFIQEGFREI